MYYNHLVVLSQCGVDNETVHRVIYRGLRALEINKLDNCCFLSVLLYFDVLTCRW